ncbi:DNA-binding PadR family transcriptional regulator [Actinoalloteichus hoggarensis]|uniref:Transcriptional regulator PadR-like family protein n=1 Tax=Actinoalloteichus hoggarensis TaxID=1470176 RepID=A0A221WB47_9PSEU|nr:PadR family transcriptional regulator [Actinoalloteichus hoggarensis]ASO22883.1 Transcriptional regulator PadR-like family protein [Actinoalloteichus hoggarensis]MBB5923975.1 DNA-binding PadR family transcriptional regulator [Actinoalloteichus hoggarensis]
MSISQTLLGLLENGPRHGYDLKRAYDERFGRERALHYGQVYSTLARLLRDGLVEVEGIEAGDGPDRKRYAITAAGRTQVVHWLETPEKPDSYLQNKLYTKVVLALMSGRDPTTLLDAQRAAHLTSMRELTRRKRGAEVTDHIVLDFALLHLEADLKWLELAASRLGPLAKEIQS